MLLKPGGLLFDEEETWCLFGHCWKECPTSLQPKHLFSVRKCSISSLERLVRWKDLFLSDLLWLDSDPPLFRQYSFELKPGVELDFLDGLWCRRWLLWPLLFSLFPCLSLFPFLWVTDKLEPPSVFSFLGPNFFVTKRDISIVSAIWRIVLYLERSGFKHSSQSCCWILWFNPYYSLDTISCELCFSSSPNNEKNSLSWEAYSLTDKEPWWKCCSLRRCWALKSGGKQ